MFTRKEMHPNLEIPQRHLMCAIGWTPFLTQYCYHWVVIRHQLLTNFYGPRLTHNPMRMFRRNIITGPNIPNFCRTCVCHQHTIHSVVQETPRWRREDCTWIFLRSTSRKSSLKKKNSSMKWKHWWHLTMGGRPRCLFCF